MALEARHFRDIPEEGRYIFKASVPPKLLVGPMNRGHTEMALQLGVDLGNMPEGSSAGLLIRSSMAVIVMPSGSDNREVPSRRGGAGNVVEFIKSLPGAGNVTVFQSRH